MNDSKLPHSLRLVIFFLRLAVGLDLFYLGFSALFNATLVGELGSRSLPDLYTWLNFSSAANGSGPSLQLFFQWAFLVIGACLVIGLLTRPMAIVAVAITLWSYLPVIGRSTLTASQFVNDEILVVVCLLVLIFSNAGTYLGVDRFIHIHLFSQHKK